MLTYFEVTKQFYKLKLIYRCFPAENQAEITWSYDRITLYRETLRPCHRPEDCNKHANELLPVNKGLSNEGLMPRIEYYEQLFRKNFENFGNAKGRVTA